MEDKKNLGINDPDLEIQYLRKRICPHCKLAIEPTGEVCPECGHYLYVKEIKYQPLSPKTTKKVKLILGLVLMGIFLVLVATGVVKLSACEEEAQKLLKFF